MNPQEVHAHQHPQTGHRWLDILLGGSALLVSCVSLFVAVEHGATMRKLVEANSWPNLNMADTLKPLDKGQGLEWESAFRNTGVGPARLRTLEFWDKGVPVHDVPDLARRVRTSLGLPSAAPGARTAAVVGDVIAANDRVVMLGLPFPELKEADAIRLARRLGEIRERYCFCSVFEECFVLDSDVSREPRPAKTCPKPKVPFNDDFMNGGLDNIPKP